MSDRRHPRFFTRLTNEPPKGQIVVPAGFKYQPEHAHVEDRGEVVYDGPQRRHRDHDRRKTLRDG